MVELTGMLAEGAQEVLEDIHKEIEKGKKWTELVDDFVTRLLMIDNVFIHTQMEYSDYDELHDFLVEISELIVELRDTLEKLRGAEEHFLLLIEAADKEGPVWISLHFKKIRPEIKELEKIERQVIFVIDAFLEHLKNLLSQSENILTCDLNTGEVIDFHLDIDGNEEEIKHIITKLFQFILKYEKFFKEELEKSK